MLFRSKKIKKILILDLDVHQGNGNSDIFKDDKNVFTFSMHCKTNYPAKKSKSDLDIELEEKLEDKDFQQKINNLQDLLIDLTGRKLKIKTKGSAERGSIEFKYSNKADFNSLFDYLTLSANESNDSNVENVH